MTRLAPILVLLVLLAAHGGRAAAATAGGSVTATPAYERIFGTPPTTAVGSCFAMLGYLPPAADPARVRPLPLFALNRDHLLKQVIGKLLTIDRGIAARAGMTVPFPVGTRLTSLSQQDGLVRIDLKLPPGGGGDPWGMLRSLAHSAEQFPGGPRLLLSLNGKPVPGQPADGYRPSPATVVAPGPPQLLAARLGASESTPGPQELALVFDRPLRIEQLSLRAGDGREIAGERFLGVFDMAVVVHPAANFRLVVGEVLQVDWRAVDHRGRRAGKNQKLPIEVVVEP